MVAVVFVVSRIAIARAGVVFDDRPLNDGFQFLELSELEDHLFVSLAHLHSQPPLFNLFIGLVLQAPDSWVRPLFHGAYLAVGLGLALCLYAILARLGVRPMLAALLTSVFTLSPSVFLYENWAHYDYPVTLVLCVAVLALQRYEEGRRLRDAAMFFSLLAVLVLTRSLFHLFWMTLWVAVVLVYRRRHDWRPVAVVASIPLLVAASFYAHRLVRFGSFAVSSSMGISLAKITTFQLDEQERRRLVASGRLSPFALVDPQSPVRAYGELLPRRPPSGVPVLDDEEKLVNDGGTRTNFNNINYIEVSERHLDDARRTLATRPGAYARGVANAFDSYFRPASDFFTLVENRRRVDTLDKVYNLALFGVVGGGRPTDRFPESRVQYRQAPGRTAWGIVAAYCVALVGGAITLWRRPDQHVTPGPSPLVLAFLWSTITYVTILSNVLEVGENNRFHLYSDPLVLALLAGLVVAWTRHRAQGGSQGQK